MDLTSVLVALIVLCLGAAAVLAWQLRRWGEPILPARRGRPPGPAPEPAPARRPTPASRPAPEPAAAPRPAPEQAAAPRPTPATVPQNGPAPRPSPAAAPQNGPAPRPTPATAPQNGPAPRPTPATAPQNDPAPRPPPRDQGSPAAHRYIGVLAEAGRARAAVQALPGQLQDRVAMNVELMALGRTLEATEAQLGPQAAGGDAAVAELERLAGRLASIRRDAETIAADLELLAIREARLTAQAAQLRAELAALERSAPFPVAAGPYAAAGAELLDRVQRIPPRAEIGSFNALKYRLREAEELCGSVAHCYAGLRAAVDPRGALRALFEGQAPPAPTPAPPAPTPTPAPEDKKAADLERTLLLMVGGDRAVLERLVALERERAPAASRATLLRSAIEQLRRDRR